MKRKLLFFAPILLALLINPYTLLLSSTFLPKVESPENARIFVKGRESGLIVNSGDRLSMTSTFSIVKDTGFSIEAIGELKIDGEAVEDEVSIIPGEHTINYEGQVPEVDFPSSLILFHMRPLNPEFDDVRLMVLGLPRNFEVLKTLSLFAVFGEIAGIALSAFLFFRINTWGEKAVREEKSQLKRQMDLMSEKTSRLEQKVKGLFNANLDFIAENGLLKDFDSFVKENRDNFALKEELEKSTIFVTEKLEEDRPIRLILRRILKRGQ